MFWKMSVHVSEPASLRRHVKNPNGQVHADEASGSSNEDDTTSSAQVPTVLVRNLRAAHPTLHKCSESWWCRRHPQQCIVRAKVSQAFLRGLDCKHGLDDEVPRSYQL